MKDEKVKHEVEEKVTAAAEVKAAPEKTIPREKQRAAPEKKAAVKQDVKKKIIDKKKEEEKDSGTNAILTDYEAALERRHQELRSKNKIKYTRRLKLPSLNMLLLLLKLERVLLLHLMAQLMQM